MISNHHEAYVWVWLPGRTEPVVAGRLYRDGARLAFNYGRSYLDRPDACLYTHLRAHETVLDLGCRLFLGKKKKTRTTECNISAVYDN